MARYNLIFPDSIYKELFDQATAQKQSMGKFLNVILEKQARDKSLVVEKVVVKEILKNVFICPGCLKHFDGANECIKHAKTCEAVAKMRVVL
jgi:hypothetical protein